MVRGRKTGQIELEISEIMTIIHLTLLNKYSRNEIASKVGRSNNTIWRYQKYFGLI